MPLCILTENLIIRQLAESDLPAFASYRAIPEVARYQNWSNYTLHDAELLFAKMCGLPFAKEGEWFQLSIKFRNSDALAGDLAVHFIDSQQVEIGFTLSPEYQKKGIALEALTGLLNYLFHDIKRHRVIAITDVENSASCRLLEKAGFRKEAHFIENIFFKGSWGSEYVYAILGSEWNKAYENRGFKPHSPLSS